MAVVKNLAQTKNQDIEELEHGLCHLEQMLFIANENGFLKDDSATYEAITDIINKGLQNLSKNQTNEARKNFSLANFQFNNAMNSTSFGWRFKYSYGGPIILYLLTILISIFLAWIFFSPSLVGYTMLWIPSWAFLWGSAGGILQGFWFLWQHICDQCLRKHWFIWYILLPLVGAILGALTYLVFLSGFIVATGGTQITSEFFVILLCALAGFSSRWAVEILDRLTTMIKVGG